MHAFANERVLMSAKKKNKYLTTGKDLFGRISPPQLRLLITVCTREALCCVPSLANTLSCPQPVGREQWGAHIPSGCSHARLEGSGSVPSRAQWELSIFFMKVWIPGKAVGKKDQGCKATYQISWLLITRGALGRVEKGAWWGARGAFSAFGS